MNDIESNLNWWIRILGFPPEKHFRESSLEDKCYNCGSKNVERLPSGSWTSKKKCGDCGYYNYIVYQDRMGEGLADDVAVSPINNEEF